MGLNKFEKFIEKHIDKDWDWGSHGLSRNPRLTMEFLEKHIDKYWLWGRDGFSSNPSTSLTMEFVEKYIDKDWYWGSKNPSITMEFLEKYIDKDWDWGQLGLSSNPSITIEFLEKHIDKDWHWGSYGLSLNPFTYELQREREIEDKAARIIQNGCHDLLWAPNHNGKPGLMVTRMLKDLEEIDYKN